MDAFWNGDHLEDFLFKGLNTKSWGGLFGVCVALASIALLYEGLHLLKRYFLNRFIKVRKQIRVMCYEEQPGGVINPSQRRHRGNEIGSGEPAPRSLLEETDNHNTTVQTPPKLCSYQSGLMDLGISSILHSIYMFIGFTLMNAVMTFNVWIMVSVCAGIALGYFFFGNYRRTDNLMHPFGTGTTSLNDSGSTSPARETRINDNGDYPTTSSPWIPSLSGQEPEESSRLIDVGAEVHTPRIISGSLS